MSKIPLLFRGPVADGSGYSVNARNLLIELDRTGKFDIQLENYLGSSVEAKLEPGVADKFNAMIRNKIDKANAALFQVSIAAQFKSDCKWNFGYSTFETNRVPFSWVIPANRMTGVFVPCEQNRQAFVDTGVTTPVKVVPHGVTDDLRSEFYEPLTMFADKRNFLFVGTPQYRKGIDLALSAYLQGFGDTTDTRLICKVYLEKSSFNEELNLVRNMVKEARKKLNKHGGEIIVIPEYITDEQLRRLYLSVDALVFASRGEGWGFAGSEAAALGTPVIATLWGGPADYLNDQIAYSVDYKLDLVKNMQFNPQFLLAQMEGHEWAEPDIGSLVRAMKQVYSNPQEARVKGAKAANHLRENFSWQKAGQKAAAYIEEAVNG